MRIVGIAWPRFGTLGHVVDRFGEDLDACGVQLASPRLYRLAAGAVCPCVDPHGVRRCGVVPAPPPVAVVTVEALRQRTFPLGLRAPGLDHTAMLVIGNDLEHRIEPRMPRSATRGAGGACVTDPTPNVRDSGDKTETSSSLASVRLGCTPFSAVASSVPIIGAGRGVLPAGTMRSCVV